MATIKETLASFAPKTPIINIPATSSMPKYTTPSSKTGVYAPLTEPIQSKVPTTTSTTSNIQSKVTDKPATSTIPVQALTTTQPTIPDFNQTTPSSVTTSINQALNTPPPEVTKAQPSTKDTIQSKILELAGRDTIAQREQIRTDAMTAEKEKTARDLSNRLTARKTAYERQIEELEKNPEGKLTGSLNAEINDLQRKANRELADISVQYNVALGDYQAAEKIVSERIADLNTQMQQETNLWKTAYDFVQNDMTESEKLQASQAWEMKMKEYDAEIAGYKTGQETALQQAQADNYQNLLDTGAITLDKVPKEVVAFLDTQGYLTPEQKAAKTNTLNRMDTILDLATKPLGTAVGPGIQQLFGKVGGFVGLGNYESRKKVVDTLISQVAVDVLPSLKGPASDKDIEFVKAAASSLSPNSGEKAFKEQLLTLTDRIVTGVVNSTAYTPEEKITIAAKAFKVKSPNATPEQITEMVKATYPDIVSFNQAGNATASKLANAIKQVESGGKYSAVGDSGTSKGAYQFNGDNFNSWSKQYFGKTLPFTPQNQDLVAEARIQDLLDQGYNEEQVALIWNGGEPVRKKGYNAKIGMAYDSGAYADKVIRQLNA